jgi:glycosyltransferase involved in cell wall biosynthesis
MRLALFSYGLPAPHEKRGGIERVAHSLAQGLAERNHEVVVYSHDASPAGALYEVRELPWKRFVNTWFGRRATMGYLGNALAVLPDYRAFDAVIAFGDSLLIPFVHRRVLRVMLGSALGEARAAQSIGRFVLQSGVYIQELVTAILQTTVGISENTRRFNPFVRHTAVLGVDSRIFFSAADQKTASPSVMFVGTAEGRKRGQMLLDAFSGIVRPSFPDATLMFVGPQGRALPGVSYHTGVSDEELATLYRRAWVYASPSIYEGFGLPYLEAMACGTAVVASPNPGSREVMADGSGMLVDDERFGAALVDVLSNAAQRRDLETAGLRRAEELSLASMIDRYESILSGLCRGHVPTTIART